MDDAQEGWITWLDVSVKSTITGLVIRAKADPKLEALMASLGTGSTDSLEAYAKTWGSPNPEVPVMVYKMARNPELGSGRRTYSLHDVGGSFEDADGLVNLSFLRIQGISKADGTTFKVNVPISLYKAKELKHTLLEATRQLVLDNLVPFHINFKLISRELP